jgi:crossover junction endodeoxyribonuclease RuvC
MRGRSLGAGLLTKFPGPLWRWPCAGFSAKPVNMSPAPIRILGLDPGLRNTGWGVIEAQGTRLSFIACGRVSTDGAETVSNRLRQLHEGLTRVIAEHSPSEAAVEETFVNRDPQSALKLGQARGLALAIPALAGLAVEEYAANLVKKTIVGNGHADKKQVAVMVRVLLPASAPTSADAADALAVAICHAQHRSAHSLARTMAALSRATRG